MSPETIVKCARCGRPFEPRFRFQSIEQEGKLVHYCSQTCREPALRGGEVACSVCGQAFQPSLALHVAHVDGGVRYFCSTACRRSQEKPAREDPPGHRPRTLAILNQKGGTAKTTTAVSVAAGLAQLGHRTLLIDLDPQGNVGVSLGVRGPRTMFHVLARGASVSHCIVEARPRLDVVTADSGLAAVEVELARRPPEERMLVVEEALADLNDYEYVVFDCAPALSILNHGALAYAGEVLIPVSCDYLALVGVKQVLGTLRRVTEQTGRAVRVAGVLPTFFDVRNRLSAEAVSYLRKTFGARTLPPVRVNTKLAEAPSAKKTIFEYAPDSNGARDYIRVVEWIRTGRERATPRAA